MRLDRNARIAGQPVKRIRELLRRMGDTNWTQQRIANFFQIEAAEACMLIDEMSMRGLLQGSERRPGDSDLFYACGPKGTRFRSARLLKPISRPKADAIIAALLQRVERINERADLLERVCEVRVFGSYLEQRDDLGDVDIAVKTERKENAGQGWAYASLRRAGESGRVFSSFIDRLSYGHTEVMRLLKAGNQYLSLHTMDDLQKIGAPSKVLFKDSS